MSVPIRVTVNGAPHEHEVEPRLLLVHYLRDVLRLTGTHVGCDTSSCGACTVVLNGRAVKSCTMLAPTASCTPSRQDSRRCTDCSAGSARRA